MKNIICPNCNEPAFIRASYNNDNKRNLGCTNGHTWIHAFEYNDIVLDKNSSKFKWVGKFPIPWESIK